MFINSCIMMFCNLFIFILIDLENWDANRTKKLIKSRALLSYRFQEELF